MGKNRKSWSASVFVLILLTTTPTFASVMYTGSLSTGDNGILGTGSWLTDSTTLSWTVSRASQPTWHYQYTLSGISRDVSHMIIEVSDTFTLAELLNATGPFSGTDVDYYDEHSGNPEMPGSVHGVKFDDMTGTSVTISFDSPRMPVWGDFYAKDGKSAGVDNTMWNAGFTNADPTAPAANGPLAGHLLVPDTYVPDPATLMLLATGIFQLSLRRTRP